MNPLKTIFLILFFLIFSTYGFCDDSLVVDDTGNVGIGTQNPTSKLEVNGDLQVNGIIKKGGDYADWYVGNYYSIPVDQRTYGWDWSISELTTTWTTIDLSSKLPEGTKKVRIFLDARGRSKKNGRIKLKFRPSGSASDYWVQTSKVLLQTNSIGQSRIAIEIEVDVTNGQFEISEDSTTWDVSFVSMQLRGFYM